MASFNPVGEGIFQPSSAFLARQLQGVGNGSTYRLATDSILAPLL